MKNSPLHPIHICMLTLQIFFLNTKRCGIAILPETTDTFHRQTIKYSRHAHKLSDLKKYFPLKKETRTKIQHILKQMNPLQEVDVTEQQTSRDNHQK